MNPLKIKRPSNGDYRHFKKDFALYSHRNKVHIQMVIIGISKKTLLRTPMETRSIFKCCPLYSIICKHNLTTKFKHKSPSLPHIHPWSDERNYLHCILEQLMKIYNVVGTCHMTINPYCRSVVLRDWWL